MALIRFYEELNRFLAKNIKKKDIDLSVDKKVSVKKVIEDLGVPHTEVDLILVNGQSVDFSYPVGTEDRISVYPVFESFDIKESSRVRPAALRETRFVLDVNLCALARWLRRLGFDTLYSNNYGDGTPARISAEENRILLTKDRGLLKQKIVTRGYCIRSDNTLEQVREVIFRFQLESSCRPLIRCPHCNETLEVIDKDRIPSILPEYVQQHHHEEYRFCELCGKVFRKSPHWETMKQQLLS